MSNRTRGLFDPRRRMQNWPEPHDDPNIPYVWGQGTTNLGEFRSNPKLDQDKLRKAGLNLSPEMIKAIEQQTYSGKMPVWTPTYGSGSGIPASGSSKSKKLWWILGGVSVVGLGVGVYMYTKL